uniref:Uncharacterized protein n=1 Tax=Anguilla anguilla TaxID=7936 RepID=A0A0E9VPG3_ANGAN
MFIDLNRCAQQNMISLSLLQDSGFNGFLGNSQYQ